MLIENLLDLLVNVALLQERILIEYDESQCSVVVVEEVIKTPGCEKPALIHTMKKRFAAQFFVYKK